MPDRVSPIYVLSAALIATAPAAARTRQPEAQPPCAPVHAEIRATAGGFEIVTASAASRGRAGPLVRLGQSVQLDRRLADGASSVRAGGPQ